MAVEQGRLGQFGPQRVGRGRGVAGPQPRPGQPALLASGVADIAVDRQADRAQQVLQSADKARVEHVAVAIAGQFGQVFNDARHGRSMVSASAQMNTSAPA